VGTNFLQNNPIQRYFAGCPDNAFQKVPSGYKPFTLAQRACQIPPPSLPLMDKFSTLAQRPVQRYPPPSSYPFSPYEQTPHPDPMCRSDTPSPVHALTFGTPVMPGEASGFISRKHRQALPPPPLLKFCLHGGIHYAVWMVCQ